MEMQEVSSSNIRLIGYDEANKTMGVVFHSGNLYHFFDVPKEVHDELVEAPSVGRQFNISVRDQYEYEDKGPYSG
ncbi:MAG: KTSC domain-containing protein [bacterium]